MRHKELRDNIDGSVLKKDYLEAFLMQSAYLEGVLKYIADYNFFIYLKPSKSSKDISENFYKEMRKDFGNKSLFDFINFLNKTGVFDDALKKQLHTYREKRNEVLHDLVGKIADKKFEKDIEDACRLGSSIFENKNFSKMINLIEEIDQERYKELAEDKKE
jgi:hypothetical protein